MHRTKIIGSLIGAFAGAVLLTATVSAAAPADRWQIADSRLDALDALVDSHPESFGGLSVDPDSHRVIVRVIDRQDRALVRRLLTALRRDARDESDAQWTIVLQPVKRTLRDLESIRAALLADDALAGTVKPVFAQVHVDIQRNVVALGVTAVSEELYEALRANYGDAVEVYVTERMHAFSRALPSSDGALASGGLIKLEQDGHGDHCTSGWPIRSSVGFKGFTTAGHCVMNFQPLVAVQDNANVYLGSAVAYRVSFAEKDNLGASWSQDTDVAFVSDFALIGSVPVEPRIYIGNANTSTKRYIVGSRSVRVGDRVCFGGAFTGENCNAVIQTTSATAAVFIGSGGIGIGLTIGGLVEAKSPDGSVIGQPGDSGGPVYVKSSIGLNTVIQAVGTIEAGPVHAPSSDVVFVPIAKVIPNGYSLWTAKCSLNIFGGLNCTTN